MFEGVWCGHRIAVKCLHSNDEESSSALHRELKLMHKLPPHPNVLRILVRDFDCFSF